MKNEKLRFTQEVKDNWIKQLKSGEYKQGFGDLYIYKDGSYCCIEVLQECYDLDEPYVFLEDAVGFDTVTKLIQANDNHLDRNNPEYPRDYSNVLPLIEALPVQEEEVLLCEEVAMTEQDFG